ncbi:MAG: hypothetical protein J0L70_31070 [Leptolyngbya sp. UWPOB_LEPTO1]|uniref:hypothetical protein n=1 Tax=Leptolyngbya sp. UWPOB_LEPTO1 TaxID=2815653 RepID=UPI001AD27F67|nr:hypothetical protein [Leptolyngbya sp. UWPOB_LEPTO1]MBN8564957.1 hypothetical protein [Leptolyngbya sp. UWPOB_LEPTO1]
MNQAVLDLSTCKLIVFEIVCVLALVGLSVSYFRMRHAWLWWSQRQFLRSHEEAEIIRDRLLQQSFTMRRGLESALIDTHDSSLKACLEQFNLFHQSLNALSDRLSPPYIEDNLLLAITHLLNSWKSKQTGLTIEFEHPSVWHQATHPSDAFLLEAINELLRIITVNVLTAKVIFVSLNNVNHQVNLEIRIPNTETLNIRADLKHLTQAMHFLVGGHCSFSYQQQTLTWHYRQQRSTAFAPPTCKD